MIIHHDTAEKKELEQGIYACKIKHTLASDHILQYLVQ